MSFHFTLPIHSPCLRNPDTVSIPMATALSTATVLLSAAAASPTSITSSLFKAAPAISIHPLIRSASGATVGTRSRRLVVPSRAMASDDRVELGENPEGIISGEWPSSSLMSFDDLRAYFEPQILKDMMSPTAPLRDVMSTEIRSARPDQSLEEIEDYFQVVSGLPVIDEQGKCVGVVSKKDKDKAPDGLKSKVSEVMSSPAITLSPERTVTDAAALMLKMKIHRIPIVDRGGKVIGMVTRTDIFKRLEVAVAAA